MFDFLNLTEYDIQRLTIFKDVQSVLITGAALTQDKSDILLDVVLTMRNTGSKSKMNPSSRGDTVKEKHTLSELAFCLIEPDTVVFTMLFKEWAEQIDHLMSQEMTLNAFADYQRAKEIIKSIKDSFSDKGYFYSKAYFIVRKLGMRKFPEGHYYYKFAQDYQKTLKKHATQQVHQQRMESRASARKTEQIEAQQKMILDQPSKLLSCEDICRLTPVQTQHFSVAELREKSMALILKLSITRPEFSKDLQDQYDGQIFAYSTYQKYCTMPGELKFNHESEVVPSIKLDRCYFSRKLRYMSKLQSLPQLCTDIREHYETFSLKVRVLLFKTFCTGKADKLVDMRQLFNYYAIRDPLSSLGIMMNCIADQLVYVDRLFLLQVLSLMRDKTPEELNENFKLNFINLQDYFTFDNNFNFYKFRELYKVNFSNKPHSIAHSLSGYKSDEIEHPLKIIAMLAYGYDMDGPWVIALNRYQSRSKRNKCSDYVVVKKDRFRVKMQDQGSGYVEDLTKPFIYGFSITNQFLSMHVTLDEIISGSLSKIGPIDNLFHYLPRCNLNEIKFKNDGKNYHFEAMKIASAINFGIRGNIKLDDSVSPKNVKKEPKSKEASEDRKMLQTLAGHAFKEHFTPDEQKVMIEMLSFMQVLPSLRMRGEARDKDTWEKKDYEESAELILNCKFKGKGVSKKMDDVHEARRELLRYLESKLEKDELEKKMRSAYIAHNQRGHRRNSESQEEENDEKSEEMFMDSRLNEAAKKGEDLLEGGFITKLSGETVNVGELQTSLFKKVAAEKSKVKVKMSKDDRAKEQLKKRNEKAAIKESAQKIKAKKMIDKKNETEIKAEKARCTKNQAMLELITTLQTLPFDEPEEKSEDDEEQDEDGDDNNEEEQDDGQDEDVDQNEEQQDEEEVVSKNKFSEVPPVVTQSQLSRLERKARKTILEKPQGEKIMEALDEDPRKTKYSKRRVYASLQLYDLGESMRYSDYENLNAIVMLFKCFSKAKIVSRSNTKQLIDQLRYGNQVDPEASIALDSFYKIEQFKINHPELIDQFNQASRTIATNMQVEHFDLRMIDDNDPIVSILAQKKGINLISELKGINIDCAVKDLATVAEEIDLSICCHTAALEKLVKEHHKLAKSNPFDYKLDAHINTTNWYQRKLTDVKVAKVIIQGLLKYMVEKRINSQDMRQEMKASYLKIKLSEEQRHDLHQMRTMALQSIPSNIKYKDQISETIVAQTSFSYPQKVLAKELQKGMVSIYYKDQMREHCQFAFFIGEAYDGRTLKSLCERIKFLITEKNAPLHNFKVQEKDICALSDKQNVKLRKGGRRLYFRYHHDGNCVLKDGQMMSERPRYEGQHFTLKEAEDQWTINGIPYLDADIARPHGQNTAVVLTPEQMREMFPPPLYMKFFGKQSASKQEIPSHRSEREMDMKEGDDENEEMEQQQCNTEEIETVQSLMKTSPQKDQGFNNYFGSPTFNRFQPSPSQPSTKASKAGSVVSYKQTTLPSGPPPRVLNQALTSTHIPKVENKKKGPTTVSRHQVQSDDDYSEDEEEAKREAAMMIYLKRQDPQWDTRSAAQKKKAIKAYKSKKPGKVDGNHTTRVSEPAAPKKKTEAPKKADKGVRGGNKSLAKADQEDGDYKPTKGKKRTK